MRRFDLRVVLVLLVATSLVLGLAAPAIAGSGGDSQPVIGLPGIVLLPNAAPEPTGITEASSNFGLSGQSRVVVVNEANSVQPGLVQPDFAVELGWNIYVYLSREDWTFLAGIPASAASAAICFWLTPTVGGAIACSVAVYIVTYLLIKNSAPPVGYCKRIVFRYWGAYVGMSNVRRSC